MSDQVKNLVRVTDFVVIPRYNFYESISQSDTSFCIEDRSTIRGVSHAGDGNIHLDVLRKGFADEGDEKQKVAAFEDKACQAAYELGGAISGEHGIGQARKALFAKYTDPVELALMKAVKQAWDPKNILNPGKIFD